MDNRETLINELDTQLEFAKFTNSNGVLISAKCAQFCLEHVQYYEQKIKELTEENERLRKENEALAISEVKECEISQMIVYRIRDKHPAVMAVIADTVRKMQAEIARRCIEGGIYPAFVASTIDQIAKEMIE